MIKAVMDCPIPIIAAVNGAAFAGGLELALACDFIYAARSARFALTEVSLGIMPGAAGTQNLPRAVGVRRAKEIVLTAAPFTAEQALQWGLVNKVCADDELMAETLAVATRIALNAPISARQAKKSLDKATEWRNLYRRTHKEVVEFWRAADVTLRMLAEKKDYNWSIFRCASGKLYLPNGTCLQYPELEWARDEEGKWRYRSRYGLRRIWGGFLVENVIQAASRVDIGQCMLRLQDKGYRIVLMEHDCLGVLVRNETAERDREIILEEMRRPPEWCPGIPLDAEATMGDSYA